MIIDRFNYLHEVFITTNYCYINLLPFATNQLIFSQSLCLFWKSKVCYADVSSSHKFIQAYLGYYVTSKLRLFTPGPIHRLGAAII
jgi:hypothetical protein